MQMMTDGLKAAAGKQMNTLLAKPTGNPLLGAITGAIVTAVILSPSVTILFGAKIGTGITAILAAIGKPPDAKCAAAVHVLFNVLGALIWLPLIAQLAGLAELVSPVAARLHGLKRLAEEVPRQIANAATIWATANTVIFLPFAPLFAKMASQLIPDRVVDERAIIRPRYLDDALIQVPSMALERVRMGLRHMGELTEVMLAKVRSAFAARDLSELSQQYDQVVVLREAVLAYLQHVGRSELSDTEADEHARLVAATGDGPLVF